MSFSTTDMVSFLTGHCVLNLKLWKHQQFQETGTINYPNDYGFTRITEFKHLTGQKHDKTTLVYEYPEATGDPYYPVPRPENEQLYKKYAALANQLTNTYFVGRLATYRYYNMDQVVAQALTTFKKIMQSEFVHQTAIR